MVVIAVLIGLAGGFAAILFRYLIEGSTYAFSGGATIAPSGFADLPWIWLLFMPAAGGLIVGGLAAWLAPEVKGTGIPEVMEAVALKGAQVRKRVAVVKAAAVAACLGSGGSAGREGPIVHVGAAVGSLVGQVLRVPVSQLRTFVGCGAAAGIAATFNAPIAGAMFAGEVILGEFGVVSFSAIVISSVVATVVSRHFIGDFPAFIHEPFTMLHTYELGFYAGLGLVAALLGCLFIVAMDRTRRLFERAPVHPVLRPALGGLVVGGLGIALPQVLGVGYAGINGAMDSQLVWGTMAALLGAKLLATAITLGSGGSGGIFAPSLFIGAMLGGVVGVGLEHLLPGDVGDPGSYALVAMGAMVAATTRASITAIIIIFEMTNNYTIILPLMIACILAMLVAGQFVKPSIYQAKLLQRGVNLSDQHDVNILRRITVADVDLWRPASIRKNTKLADVLELAMEHGDGHYVVEARNGDFEGLIRLREIRYLFFERDELADLIVAADLVNHEIPPLAPSDSLDLALKVMSKTKLTTLPVLDPEDPKKLLGVLTRGAVIETYNRELLERDMVGETAALMVTAERARSVDLGEGTALMEIEAPRACVGKRLADLHLRRRYDVQVVLVKRRAADGDEELVREVPGPDLEIENGDILLLLGTPEGLNRIAES